MGQGDGSVYVFQESRFSAVMAIVLAFLSLVHLHLLFGRMLARTSCFIPTQFSSGFRIAGHLPDIDVRKKMSTAVLS